MRRIHSRHRTRTLIPRKIARGLAVLAASVWVSGCAVSSGWIENREFDRKDAATVISAGLRNAQTYYITKPDIPRMTEAGLNGLRQIDRGFRATRTADGAGGGALVLLYEGAEITRLAAPEAENAERWGQLAATAIEAARTHSPTIRNTKSERLYELVFDRALKGFDTFSRYLTAAEARDSRARRRGYSGVGVRLGRDGGHILVRAVFEDSPASAAGLQPGDRLVAIDGVPVQGQSLPEVVAVMRGAKGTPLTLEIMRGGTRLAHTLTRSAVIEQTIFMRRIGGVAVIRIASFNRTSFAALRRKLKAAMRDAAEEKLTGAILDLRGNRGGALTEAVSLADLFIADGLILRTVGRHGDATDSYRAAADDEGEDLALVVLIDRKSASASEVVAAALQDNGRAVSIGTRSYGKGTVQWVLTMPNSGEISITWAQMYGPTGYALSGLGVFPTLCSGDLAASPDGALSQIRRGDAPNRALAALRRDADSADAKAKAHLKRQCGKRPPRWQGKDYDLHLALALLADRALHSRLLAEGPAIH